MKFDWGAVDVATKTAVGMFIWWLSLTFGLRFPGPAGSLLNLALSFGLGTLVAQRFLQRPRLTFTWDINNVPIDKASWVMRSTDRPKAVTHKVTASRCSPVFKPLMRWVADQKVRLRVTVLPAGVFFLKDDVTLEPVYSEVGRDGFLFTLPHVAEEDVVVGWVRVEWRPMKDDVAMACKVKTRLETVKGERPSLLRLVNLVVNVEQAEVEVVE